jgi:predicted tellurium resistance membrane protein TerC
MNWDFHVLFTGEGITALLTLAVMEIVLGIDNVVFIAILVGRLPKVQQKLARQVGMSLALVCRLGLLGGIKYVMGLTRPLFTMPLMGKEMTGQKLILLAGGLFLMAKASYEIYEKLEGDEGEIQEKGGTANFAGLIVQLILLDMVFSLDSVITAVGMAKEIVIMVVAMFAAVGVMMAAAGRIGEFVHKHPSVKILALAFLNLIGVMLMAEAFGQHVEKGYIYFAMAFSLGVELLNMRFRKKHKPVKLHDNTQILRRNPA